MQLACIKSEVQISMSCMPGHALHPRALQSQMPRCGHHVPKYFLRSRFSSIAYSWLFDAAMPSGEGVSRSSTGFSLLAWHHVRKFSGWFTRQPAPLKNHSLSITIRNGFYCLHSCMPMALEAILLPSACIGAQSASICIHHAGNLQRLLSATI